MYHRKDVSSSSAGYLPPASMDALPPSRTAVVAQPDAKRGATGYPAEALAIRILPMLRVQPPFACKLKLPGRTRAWVDFLASTWEVDMET